MVILIVMRIYGGKLTGINQVEQDTKEHYAKKAHRWGKGMGIFEQSTPKLNAVNHVLALILCWKNGHSDWTAICCKNQSNGSACILSTFTPSAKSECDLTYKHSTTH